MWNFYSADKLFPPLAYYNKFYYLVASLFREQLYETVPSNPSAIHRYAHNDPAC